jgi:hypothetical protein
MRGGCFIGEAVLITETSRANDRREKRRAEIGPAGGLREQQQPPLAAWGGDPDGL